ncbi:MAG: hypothetical protein EBE86_034995 [Hormoscilla sp. GUM202]|nr:hypothetical protein [Hormoscilla sp. GUM202]
MVDYTKLRDLLAEKNCVNYRSKKPGFCDIFRSSPKVELRNPVSGPTGDRLSGVARNRVSTITSSLYPGLTSYNPVSDPRVGGDRL